MQIKYCPICGKAGLKGEDDQGRSTWDVPLHDDQLLWWCPRDKTWVVAKMREVRDPRRGVKRKWQSAPLV